jgi:hypothetical protein
LSFTGGKLNYGSSTNEQGLQTGSVAHRRAWESGQVDYQGIDSFNNIQEQLEKNIALQQQQYHPSQLRQITPPQFVDLSLFFRWNFFSFLNLRSTSAHSSNNTGQTATVVGEVLKTTTITTTTTTTQE